jgi:hypothetical protein
MKKQICELLEISPASYYRWRGKRKGLILLEKYFTEKDLDEFLRTGKISKMENKKTWNKKEEEFILKTAMYKINEASKKWTMDPSKKVISKKLFIESLRDAITANELLDNLKNQKSWNKNIVQITYDFFINMISEIEIEALINNKKEIIAKESHK